jgi:hypothetical protein
VVSIPAGPIFMKTLKLSKGFVALVDDADYERVSARDWYLVTHKTKRTVYAASTEGKTKIRMHRFILGITDPKVQVDHEDHNGLNNQRHNLRFCNHQQNQANKPKQRGTYSSQFKGVRWDKQRNKWRAQLWVNGRKVYPGTFTDEVQAALAYDAAAREHFGEFAYCNFPPQKPCSNSAPASMIAAGQNAA